MIQPISFPHVVFVSPCQPTRPIRKKSPFDRKQSNWNYTFLEVDYLRATEKLITGHVNFEVILLLLELVPG